ncbi:hypothetical protein [Nostoc sp. KVJ20]|nr:hypothetical protein [Nostoc sp. KVJ20]
MPVCQHTGILTCWYIEGKIVNIEKYSNMLVHQYAADRNMLEKSRRIPIQRMVKYIDLSKFWTEESDLSIETAHEKTGLNRRTLSSAKKGLLDRCQIDTLFKLKDLASDLAGREVSFDEIFKDDQA